jgi:phage terminase small subunit
MPKGIPTKPKAMASKRRQFVAEYLANGGNATRAYLSAYPNCTSYQAAAVDGFRLLRNPKIRTLIEAANAERWKRLEMQGDEAMALLSQSARADIGDALDPETGEILPVYLWPERLRLSVKGLKADGSVTLTDPLRARELMAQAAGRIKNTVDVLHKFDHAAYLTEDK